MNSVLSKALENLVLSRMEVGLAEAGFPHINQTAFRKHVGCADGIFASQEIIARYMNEGSTVHMCLLDLQKAFDSVEFPVLLDRLFAIGINGKTWRLVRNWYEGGTCSVLVDGAISMPFTIERGVRQGSVLSPTLFNIVMDPLLELLESSGLGLCVNGLYGGAYLHADDVRTLSASVSSLQAQINIVLNFAKGNFLQLNPSKCEIVSFSQSNNIQHPICEIEGEVLQASGTAKCLGYQWNHDLSAKPSVEYNVTKARKSFFAYGSMGLFQGDLSPLSGRSMVDTCILPILLYGAENWCLSYNSLQVLDSFLGELSKRLLKLPQWYSNTPASIVAGQRSARALCLTRKLNFLKKISAVESRETLSAQTITSLSDDINSTCLVRECRDLEQYFSTVFTSAILEPNADSCPHPDDIKEEITKRDRDLLLTQHEGRADMTIVVEVERAIGWPRLWDLALDNGAKCIEGLKNLVRVITFPPHAMRACPLCEREDICRDSLLHHTLNSHTSCHLSSKEFLQELLAVSDADSVFFTHLCHLTKLFAT